MQYDSQQTKFVQVCFQDWEIDGLLGLIVVWVGLTHVCFRFLSNCNLHSQSWARLLFEQIQYFNFAFDGLPIIWFLYKSVIMAFEMFRFLKTIQDKHSQKEHLAKLLVKKHEFQR